MMDFADDSYNELEIVIPQVNIYGPYAIEGKVFFIPISGYGGTNITLGE